MVSAERAKLLRVQRRRPTSVSARALLLPSLVKIAHMKRKAGVHQDRHVGTKVWNRMSHMDKNVFRAEASSRQGAGGLQLDTEAQKIRGEICELQDEARPTSTPVSLRMSSCQLSREKTNKLETRWQKYTTIYDLHWRG